MSIAVVVPGQILFEPAQAAAVLGVSERKLRALKIPLTSVDTKQLYHIEDLRAFADKARNAS